VFQISSTTDFHAILCGGLYTALILLAGYSILCITFKSGARHWLEILGFSHAAGAGVVSLILFDASIAGATPSRITLFGILAMAIALLIYRRRHGGWLKPSIPAPRGKFAPVTLLGAASIGLLLLAVCNVAARAGWPVLYNIDSFAIWMLKAKWVLHQPLRPLPAVFRDPILSYSHQDYPLGFPFLVAGLYTAIGHVDDSQAAMVLVPLYLSIVAVMYSGIRAMHRRSIALTITALFAAMPVLTQHAGYAMAETMLIMAYTGTLVLLARWMETGETGCLPLAGLLAASAAFAKNEGLALLPILGIATVIAIIFRRFNLLHSPGRKAGDRPASGSFPNPIPGLAARAVKQAIFAAIVCAIAIGPWLIFRLQLPKTHEDYGGKLTSLATIKQSLPRSGYVLRKFLGSCFDVRAAGLLWIVLILVAIVGWRGFGRRVALVLWFILIAQLSLYVFTFMVTPWQLDVLVPMISGKLLMQTSPVVALLIAVHLRETEFRRGSRLP
jgi:hypothetical protein